VQSTPRLTEKMFLQASLAVVSGLQGNTQALQSYGIKLNETAIQQFAFSKGINRSVSSLTDSEKVQLRYEKLLKSFAGITGIAAASASSLADQQNALTVSLERVNAQYGKGVRVIEQNNIINGILNTVLKNVNNTVLQSAGFISALSARILQITGFIAGLSFKVFALVKLLKILQVLFKSELSIRAFNSQLPILNKSLNDLISSAAGSSIKVRSFGDVLKSVNSILAQSLKSFLLFTTGSSNFTGIFSAIASSIGKLRVALIPVLAILGKILIVISPYAVIVGAISGAILVLAKVFEEIEKRTGVFSESFDLLLLTLKEGTSVFKPIVEIFKEFGSVLSDIGSRVIGFLVARFSSFFSIAASLVSKNPFNIFSKETVSSFQNISKRLSKLSIDLESVGFDIASLGSESKRSLASISESFTNIDLEKLRELQREFANFGKTDLQLLQENFDLRIQLVNDALQNEVISNLEAQQLITKITQDFENKRAEILKKSAKKSGNEVAQALRNGVVRAVSQTAQAIGQLAIQGGNAFELLTSIALNALGDLAISIGTTVIGASKAIAGLRASLLGSPAAGIALGAALIAIGGALKAFAGSFGGSGDSGASLPSSPGGGGVAGGPFDPDFNPETGFTPEQDRERTTQSTVTVNIQGDVLDGDESRLRIAQLLEDSVKFDGAVVNTGFA